MEKSIFRKSGVIRSLLIDIKLFDKFFFFNFQSSLHINKNQVDSLPPHFYL